jgi:surface carbohydrate biosynthesis protein
VYGEPMTFAPDTRSVASGAPDTILLPVETINREFDAKLHLALRAVARGKKAIIGGRQAINACLPSLPRSIYVSKGVRVGNRHILRLMEAFGHAVVALDEESLIRQSDEALLMMIDEETFNRPKLLFAWGKSNADVWKSFHGYRGTPIVEIGNPRIDLLRPELSGYLAGDAEAIRRRFGDFILVSTNFSMVNHFIAEHVRFKTADNIDTSRAGELKSGLTAHKAVIFEAFRSIIPALAKSISPMKLVIRPHPSENPQTWVQAAAGIANVHVVHEGPIGSWLMAAKGLIQNGCTSAVEAAVVGTPTLAYRPQVSDGFEVELSNRMSIDCRTPDELLAAARNIAQGERLPGSKLDPDQLAYLKHHIASVDGPLSCERLLDSLDEHAGSLGATAAARGIQRIKARADHFRRYNLRNAVKQIYRWRKDGLYSTHKFPGMTEDMIDKGIARFRALMPDLPPVRRRQLAEHVFALEFDPGADQA